MNTPRSRLGRPKTTPKATCHPNRAHHAKGLCTSCYRSKHNAARAVAFRAYYREWWAVNGPDQNAKARAERAATTRNQ